MARVLKKLNKLKKIKVSQQNKIFSLGVVFVALFAVGGLVLLLRSFAASDYNPDAFCQYHVLGSLYGDAGGNGPANGASWSTTKSNGWTFTNPSPRVTDRFKRCALYMKTNNIGGNAGATISEGTTSKGDVIITLNNFSPAGAGVAFPHDAMVASLFNGSTTQLQKRAFLMSVMEGEGEYCSPKASAGTSCTKAQIADNFKTLGGATNPTFYNHLTALKQVAIDAGLTSAYYGTGADCTPMTLAQLQAGSGGALCVASSDFATTKTWPQAACGRLPGYYPGATGFECGKADATGATPTATPTGSATSTSTATSTGSSGGSWTWGPANYYGGGRVQEIVTDPNLAGGITLGADSWPIHNSGYTTAGYGNVWAPAAKGMGLVGTWTTLPDGSENNTAHDYEFYIMGMAYSKKYPGRVYTLRGKQSQSIGDFGYVQGNSWTTVNTTVKGGESNSYCSGRSERPRCTGHRVLVDYDSSSGTEYIYIAGGSGTGVKRSTDGGNSWTDIGLQGIGSALTTMSFAPGDTTTLYVGTFADKAYKITGVRGTPAAPQQLTAAPSRIHAIVNVAGKLYAAAYDNGLYSIGGGGSNWTPLGVGFFPAANFYTAAVGGNSSVLIASGTWDEATPAADTFGKLIAISRDGGANWSWIQASQINYSPYGTSDPSYWVYDAEGRTAFACVNTRGARCAQEVTDVAVDQFNSSIIYIATRQLVWRSDDNGANWRPAVVGMLGGDVHSINVKSNTEAISDDQDWHYVRTTDNFKSQVIADTSKSDPDPNKSLDKTINGHHYKVIMNVPRKFEIDGVSVDDEYFRQSVVRPSDIGVTPDGNHIYVALWGGNVIVASRSGTGTPTVTPTATATATATAAVTTTATATAVITPTPGPGADTTPPTVSLTSPSSGARVSGAVALSATASDASGISRVEFYLNGLKLGESTTAPYSINWSTLASPDGNYQIYARAIDASAGANAAQTTPITVLVDNIADTDTTPPTVPTGLTSPSHSASNVTLNWTASTDNVAVSQYRIYMNGNMIGSIGHPTVAYLVTGLTPSTSYSFQVSAVDTSGNESAKSSAVSVTTDTSSSAAGVQGDVNGDGHVAISELLQVLSWWKNHTAVTAGRSAGDADGDGYVSISEALTVLHIWQGGGM